jgi:hypothetical protein
VDALHRATLGIANESLALEAGRVGPEPEVDHGLDAAPRPAGRHHPGEPEPRGGPRRTPPLADGERLQVVEIGAGLDVEREALWVDERHDALGQLPGDPFLDELTVVVHHRSS